jgi:hypothetical protein
LGWKDNSPPNITDHNGITRDLKDWHDFVHEGIKRARQLAWMKNAKTRQKYKGIERGVDEATTRKHYLKLSQNDPMKAGALHTILADGVWTPKRAYKRTKTATGDCLLCGDKDAGVNHLWWDCKRLNSITDFGYNRLLMIRKRLDNKPECFWNAGVVTEDWTTLPDSIHMQSPEVCHECKGQAKTVYIDGSSYKIGKSNYSGWGLWSPDEPSFTENGALLGEKPELG